MAGVPWGDFSKYLNHYRDRIIPCHRLTLCIDSFTSMNRYNIDLIFSKLSLLLASHNLWDEIETSLARMMDDVSVIVMQFYSVLTLMQELIMCCETVMGTRLQQITSTTKGPL